MAQRFVTVTIDGVKKFTKVTDNDSSVKILSVDTWNNNPMTAAEATAIGYTWEAADE